MKRQVESQSFVPPSPHAEWHQMSRRSPAREGIARVAAKTRASSARAAASRASYRARAPGSRRSTAAARNALDSAEPGFSHTCER